ncbi:hypothetical protein D9M68_497180 [compost metagenome]|jgi:hypothetical protein
MKAVKSAKINGKGTMRYAGAWSEWRDFLVEPLRENLKRREGIPSVSQEDLRISMKSSTDALGGWLEWDDFLLGKVNHESKNSD